MNIKERAQEILQHLEGAQFMNLHQSVRATEFGLRIVVPRKVIDIQPKGDDMHDVTVYKTGCTVRIGREDATTEDLVNTIEAILSDEKGFNFQ
jgi:hypothetical protein